MCSSDLTIFATGSEMDAGAVISDMKTNDKLALFNKGMLPKASVLDAFLAISFKLCALSLLRSTLFTIPLELQSCKSIRKTSLNNELDEKSMRWLELSEIEG